VSSCVLDASALLALLQNEPGAAQVEERMLHDDCLLLTVNLTEVLTRLADHGVPMDDAERALAAFDLEIVAFDPAHARLAAELRESTRASGLSLGDHACLALAKSRNAIAVTTDRPWLTLDCGVQIECVRPEAAQTNQAQTPKSRAKRMKRQPIRGDSA
jgi:ribonuclease VapC